MPGVCDMITNCCCCCETGDKITDKLNVEHGMQYSKPTVLQSGYNLESSQNSISPSVNRTVVRRNVGEAEINAASQMEAKSMRRVFASNSQAHKERMQQNGKNLSQEQAMLQEQVDRLSLNESPDLKSADYLKIAGYQNFRPHSTVNESHLRQPFLDNSQFYGNQQQQLNKSFPMKNQAHRSRCCLSSFCCSPCCGVDEFEAVHAGPIEGNRAIILKPIRRERIVEVMVEEIQERVINVPQVQYVDKFVEVSKPVVQYKIKEVKRPVIVEKIVKVDKVVEEEKIVEVPEIRYVDKEVDVSQYVKKERIVEVPLPIVKERRIPVLKLKKNEIYQEVDNVNYNDFEIGFTPLNENEVEVPSVPYNTPVERNSVEAALDEEKSGISEPERRLQEALRDEEENGNSNVEDKPAGDVEHFSVNNERCEQTEAHFNLETELIVRQFRCETVRENARKPSLAAMHGGSTSECNTVHQTASPRIQPNDSLTIVEIISGRRSEGRDDSNIYSLGVLQDEKYHPCEAEDMISIYPNISVLSITSSPLDGTSIDGYESELEREAGQMVASATSSVRDSVEMVNHVKITKPKPKYS